MATNQDTDVVGAFEILSDEIENEIGLVSDLIAKASNERNFARVSELSAKGKAIQQFQNKLANFQEEWMSLSVNYEGEEEDVATERRHLGRLKRGQRTSHTEFYVPILAILQSMGGTARVADIAEAAERRMRSQLKEVDYEAKPSDPNTPRWRDSVGWAGTHMRKLGLLKELVQRGTWEITDKGRQYLAEHGE